MNGLRGLGAVVSAAAAAIATMFAVAWRAAEEGRGLDLADLRSVVIVALVVAGVGAWWARRDGPGGA